MAAAPKSSEQVRELLQNLEVGSQAQPGDHREISLIQEGNAANDIGNASASAVRVPVPSSNSSLLGVSDSGMYYTTNGYVMPHGFVYDHGHGGEWEENAHYIGVESMGLLSPGVYGENSSVVFHPTGFSYASQPPYAPYSPVPSMPTMGPDGQLYGPASFPYGHIYHQSAPAGAQFLPAPSRAMTAELPMSGSSGPAPPGADLSGGGIEAGNSLYLGPRPGVHLASIPPRGPYPRGVLPVALHSPVPADVRAPFEGLQGFCPGRPSWPDTARNADRQKVPVSSLSRQFTGSQTISSGYFTQSTRPAPPMQVRASIYQSQNAPSTVAAPNWSPLIHGRSNTPVPKVIPSLNGHGRAGRGVGTNTNNQVWMGVDKSKQRGRGILPFYTSNQNLDILKEQNRGPRIARLRTQRQAPGGLSSVIDPVESSVGGNDVLGVAVKCQYNQPDFQTDYDEARFFVIKSYSEDDVHKSIKYCVWASTPNGNKRLDAAYQDAQAVNGRKPGSCSIFLFFSVNASGQFCGVAEMTGPVDFNKSMDFWQQDKWNGWFPVRWGIVKDVPNSQFRHIILQNNDSKPVTNSRDTQEVKLDQGIEMLNIFKQYTAKTSILDDFHFYEARERVLLDRRGRPARQLQQHPRLVYQSSSEVGQGKISEASNCSSSEKPKDDVISFESSSTVAVGEPGVKSFPSPYAEKHPLLEIPSKASAGSTTKHDVDSHDILVSAVAYMKIKERDDVADAASSDPHL